MRTKTEFTHSKTRVFLPFDFTDPLAIHLPHLHRLNRYHFMTVYDLCIYNPCIIPCQITSGLPTSSGGSLHITFEMIGTTYSIIPALHFPKLPGIIFFNNNRYYYVLPCKKFQSRTFVWSANTASVLKVPQFFFSMALYISKKHCVPTKPKNLQHG